MTFLMKDDVNDEVPNGTPKTLISFNGGGKLRWDVKTLKIILSFATEKSMTKCLK
jgi:hypothetical protein